MRREIPGPYDPAEMRRFLDTFMYEEEAFLIDEITRLDDAARVIEGVLHTATDLPLTRFQRVYEGHPPHVSGGDVVLVTACLGCMHAWFFYGVRWDEGWTGFGNRIHRADYHRLAEVGPPMILRSRETKSRVGERRILIRYEFEFSQNGEPVYFGDQSAMFVKGYF